MRQITLQQRDNDVQAKASVEVFSFVKMIRNGVAWKKVMTIFISLKIYFQFTSSSVSITHIYVCVYYIHIKGMNSTPFYDTPL